MKRQRRWNKWFDPFWRSHLTRVYGAKKYSENWAQYVARKNIKLPKGMERSVLRTI